LDGASGPLKPATPSTTWVIRIAAKIMREHKEITERINMALLLKIHLKGEYGGLCHG
jgi:hypothetical protein